MAKDKEIPKGVSITWRAGDIKTLRPKWSEAKCEKWLAANGKYIQERLIELGWEVIEDLLVAEEVAR